MKKNIYFLEEKSALNQKINNGKNKKKYISFSYISFLFISSLLNFYKMKKNLIKLFINIKQKKEKNRIIKT